MRKNSTLLLKFLFLFLAFYSIPFDSIAGCGSGHNNGDWHPYTEFNKCNMSFNLKRIKYYEWNSGDPDDQMNFIRVYIWRNGSWQMIWRMERFGLTNGSTVDMREGVDYSYAAQNGHSVSASFWNQDIANQWFFADLSLNFIPQDVYNSGQLRIRVEAQMLNNGCGGGSGYGQLTKEFTHDFPDISSPTSLTATNNLCNSVNLSWTNSSQFWESTAGCTISGTYFVEVLRNDALLTTLSGSPTTYTDNTAVRGVNYSYTVRTGYKPTNSATTYNYSNKSTAATGLLKPNPIAPSGLEASNDRCDGTVVIEWVWSDVNPQNGFVIERATNSSFTNSTKIPLSGDKRSYSDGGLTRGISFYYRIYSRNDCWDANNVTKPGESAPSSSVIGISPSVPARATNIRLFPDSINNTITIKWNDNTAIENRYTIERTAIGGGLSIFEANVNDTFYVDDQASSCVNYNYVIKVYSECAVNGVSSVGLNQTRLTPNLTNTFDNDFYKVKVSKGYYPDRIELTWNNRNKAQLDEVRIYRKIFGGNSDSILVGSVPSGSGLYLDNTGVAGVLYKYTLIGEVQCAGVTRYSNFTEDIGFRSPSGLINGQISFNGGFAVEGVKVLAQTTAGARGASLFFDGLNDYARVLNPDPIGSSSNITIEFWNRMVRRESFMMVSKYHATNGGFRVYYDSISNSINFHIANSSGSKLLTLTNPFTNFNTFNQVTAVLNNDSLLLYINGIFRAGIQKGSVSIGSNNEPYYMGGSPVHGMYGSGYMDEVRVWNIAKVPQLIDRDFSRTIDPNNQNLMLYWTFDEKVNGLNRFFDLSNNNQVFNENHGEVLNGAFLSDSIPSTNQLSLAAYTNSLGSYSITNVRYTGTGNTYTVTPSLDIHQFSPNNKVIFLGDGSQVQNSVDFTDISSFEFTGLVRYAGTTCPATGATVLIDGQPAILNSMLVTVNDSGKFRIQVPIGNHVVSLSQNKHHFSQGRFPPVNTFNFQSIVSAQFYDSTVVEVVGRVVGGLRELNKVAGIGRSKNNIGRAQFNFNSIGQAGVNGCYTVNVVTDSNTGEYRARLYPLRYTIDGLRLVNNPDPTLLTAPSLSNPNNIDLTSIPDLISIADTFRTATLSRVDTTSYHKRLDFKYFVQPQIFVTNTSTAFDTLKNNFIGERTLKLNDTVSLDVKDNQMGFPVFLQNKYYSSIVKVLEVYTNIDKPLNHAQRLDNVPVSGTMRFFNELATFDDTIREVAISNGQFLYNFRAGTPNILRNSSNSNYDYTKTFQIEFVPDLGLTVNWQPLQTEPVIKFYRAYVFGARSGGANFTSTGPALVDFILRDPPGSASSATWSKGKAFSTTESWNLSNVYGFGKTGTLHLGTKTVVSVGVGAEVETNTEIDNNVTIGVAFSKAINEEGELVTTTTSNTTISTSSDPGSVGASADIFYGKTTNIIFGNSDEIQLIDTATCRSLEAVTGVTVCVGAELNGYKIGKQQGYYVVPGSIASTFAYTQDEILNIVIPGLEALRNQLFTRNTLNNRGQKKYTLLFSNASDPDYARKLGSNNDDPIWGALRSSSTPFTRDPQDSMGVSYVFHGDKPQDPDSVRFYNNQIRLWKNAIARNEETKYKFLQNNNAAAVNGGQNISIGKASFTQDFTSQVDDTYTESFEWNINEDLSYQFGFKFNGFGISTTGTVTFEQVRGGGSSSTTTQTNSFSYTLNDGDDGDLISVNIVDPKDGTGHVFKLIAGRTSCPYEGQKRAMFYDPSNDTITSSTLLSNGPEIQAATAQNDVPLINVQQKSIYNVPATDAAIFVLELGNLSEGRQDRTYELRVDESSNPNGAIVKVDGLDPTRSFDVPYGTTLQKTLTIEKGPLYYDYNNIRLILKSPCDDDIFDTVSVSARFLPSCTPLTLKSPDDRWVLNNSFKDTLPVLIGNYNYNYGGLKRIDFQFKPASGNVWFTEASFFKDTADVSKLIPIGTPDIYYPFKFKNLPDGKYELRAVSECVAPGYPNTRISSEILQGLADRVNPSPFGTPSPGDGIVSPNDDIAIQFNEDIDQSSLSFSNFEVKGVLNKTSLKSNTSIYLDGDNDYLEVPPGLNLQRQNFTLEFWHKRAALGEQVLFSQGADENSSFAVGFTSDNKLYFRIGSEMVTTNTNITDTTIFNFYAISYNADLQTADIIRNSSVLNIGNNKIFAPYEGSGKFYIGKSSTNAPLFTKGNFYEIRIWTKARTLSDVNLLKSTLLSGTESGLLSNWRIDEATGNSAKDYARSRNANIINAQWFLLPMGKSYSFDGASSYITSPIGHFGITKEMDFTMEFWFKSTNGNRVTLFSNGKADGSDIGSINRWAIETDSAGNILVKNNAEVFQASNKSYFDGQWHHFALVMRRSSNMSSYIDGNLEASVQSAVFEEFSGSKIWIGARGWNNLGPAIFDSTDRYFTGQIDEVRIWNSSRLAEQLKRDRNNRLTGTESGLSLYLPFESYQLLLGFPVLNQTTLDATSTNRNFTSFGSASFSSESPTIKLPRPTQDINFSYTVNGDKIILTPTTANEFIENVTLDVTVKNIKDLNGNTMQSPKTWIAYMDRNQVKWQDALRSFNKESGSALTFNTNIINSGGALKEFSLSNVPVWLKITPSSGIIPPNSSLELKVVIDPTMNIGNYESDIALNTDFGFADKLLVRVNVFGKSPSWSVNPASFSKSMSIIGQVRINNVISANTEDILAAFVGNECRGLGKVTYYEQLDKYFVFMDVYGVNENEDVEFRIWNSATGKTHVDVQPELQFVTNSRIGRVADPQIFNALDKVAQDIILIPGWNWISFNLLMQDSSNINQLFNGLNIGNGSQIKNSNELAILDETNGWSGNMAGINAGIKLDKSYLLYAVRQDTLTVKGVEANPESKPITIQNGWNYIGFVSQRNMTINDAMGSYTPRNEDLVKGQTSFAVYDSILGWVGSLNVMKPNQGFLYQSSKSGVLVYPRSGMFGKTNLVDDVPVSKYWQLKNTSFETNMNLILKTDFCKDQIANGNYLIGAFVNNELRGFAKIKMVNKELLYFLTVLGNEGEKVQFKLLNENTGLTYPFDLSLPFKSNQLAGNLKSPFILHSITDCNDLTNDQISATSMVFPVPFSTELNINFNLPKSESFNYNIFDISGKLIYSGSLGELNKGNSTSQIQIENLNSGIYFLELIGESNSFKHKIIKN